MLDSLVLYCLEKKIALDDLTSGRIQSRSAPVFEEDIYEAISIKTCVEKRMTIGAPGYDGESAQWNKRYLEEQKSVDFFRKLV